MLLRGIRRTRIDVPAGVALVLLTVAVAACGGGARRPVCAAYDALRDALQAVALAESAERSGDQAAVGQQMDEVDRLIRIANSSLEGADADPQIAPAARAMLEAANYLEFMVGDFRASGTVDSSITQFASRGLDQAGSGAGGTPLNC